MLSWGPIRRGRIGRPGFRHLGAWLYAGTSRLTAGVIPLTTSSGTSSNALSAPVITRTSGVTTYPVTFDVNRPVDWQDGDVLLTRWSTDATFATGVTEGTPVVLAGGTTTLSTGVSAIVSGTYFIEASGYHGARPANLAWSNIIGVGDASAPTITSAASFSALTTATPYAFALTANRAVSWAITGGANQDQYTVSGSTLTLIAQAVPVVAVVIVTATDLFGNTASQTITGTITSATSTWDVNYTNSLLALSNGSLTVTGAAGNGAPMKTRATNARTGKKYFEVRYDTAVGVACFAGLVNDSYAGYSDFVDPSSTSSAIALTCAPGYNDIRGPSGANTDVTSTLHGGGAGSILQVAYDTAAGKVWFGLNNTWVGSPSAGTGGSTVPTGTLYALVYVNDADVATARFASASQTYTPPTGFSSHDA